MVVFPIRSCDVADWLVASVQEQLKHCVPSRVGDCPVVAFADISTEILGLTIEMLCCPLVVEEHRAVYAFVIDDHALQQVHSHRIVGA
jgi:hypothetical protein